MSQKTLIIMVIRIPSKRRITLGEFPYKLTAQSEGNVALGKRGPSLCTVTIISSSSFSLKSSIPLLGTAVKPTQTSNGGLA